MAAQTRITRGAGTTRGLASSTKSIEKGTVKYLLNFLTGNALKDLEDQALLPADIHDPETIVRANLMKDAVYVILHGLLGYVQTQSDFLVAQAPRDQGHNLMFPPG
jgi:hypothetical protein